MITPRIIHLLGSFIGKNGLIIGNRFTALQRGNPSDSFHLPRSISLLPLPTPRSNPSITNDGNRRNPTGFSSPSFLYADNGGLAISTENNILRQVTQRSAEIFFLVFFHEHACFCTVILGHRHVLRRHAYCKALPPRDSVNNRIVTIIFMRIILEVVRGQSTYSQISSNFLEK